MPQFAGSTLTQRLTFVSPAHLAVLCVGAFAAGVLGTVGQGGLVQQAAFAVSLSLLGLVIILFFLRGTQKVVQVQTHQSIGQFIANDSAPTLITTGDGQVKSVNAAARNTFGDAVGGTLASLLADRIANPGPILFRLQSRAEGAGSAREEIVTNSGQLILAVHGIGPDGFAWRVEPQNSQQAGQLPSDNRILPMVMVGRSGAILSMNHAARQFVGARCKTLDALFTEQLLVPGTVMRVATTSGNRPALIAQTDAGAGRQAIYLLPPPEAGHGGTMGQPDWQVFQDMPIPMIKIAPNGDVQAFNKRASNMIGVGLMEGAPLSTLMEGLGRAITDWLEDTLAGRLIQKSEFLRLTRGDKETFVQVTLNRIEEDSGPALIAVLHDATELKSLEAQFVQSQKMQAIGQLAGGVAHDFNNLLTAISGHCDLLLLRHDQGDQDYSDLVQINQNANRAAALVGQLLAFSRKQTLRPETLDMRDTLADLTHLLNRLVGEKITLTLSHDPVLQPIRADKRQLEQVLMNLVVNARDAMPNGGEIRILTECTRLERPMTRDQVTVPAGDYVTIRVQDDGAGIPNDKLQKVFEPFSPQKGPARARAWVFPRLMAS